MTLLARIGLTARFLISMRSQCYDNAEELVGEIMMISNRLSKELDTLTQDEKITVTELLRELRRQLQIAQNNAASYSEQLALLNITFGAAVTQAAPSQPADQAENEQTSSR
jgi:gas vesicle protein